MFEWGGGDCNMRGMSVTPVFVNQVGFKFSAGLLQGVVLVPLMLVLGFDVCLD